MKYFKRFSFVFVLAAMFSFPVLSQETEVRVVDEVVAQVNDGVITLSRIKREMKEAVDAFMQQGQSREQAEKNVQEKQGELIANLINEELLIQRSKELGLESDIGRAVNERLVELMKANDLRTIEALYEEMEKSGVDPKEYRESLRKQITRELVIQREVQARLYWESSGQQLKEYYEKNKARFLKPETVSISEIFLGFAGRNEAEVRAKSKELYDKLRSGGDFTKLAAENSDRPLVTDGVGKLENLSVKDMVDVLANALKNIPQGGYTEPFEANDLGMVILRVDKREKASSESVYDENAVRMAILNEKFPVELPKYMAKVRGDSLIKINERYRPIVSPILFADERKQKAAN